MRRPFGNVPKWLLVLVPLFFSAAELQAGHYRFWLHGQVQLPFYIRRVPGETIIDTIGGSDCWGWTSPDGTEYAIMGVHGGVAIVNAHTMEVKAAVPGPQTPVTYMWRDMETYRHYVYAVSEMSGTNQGLMVIDLQYLPDSVHFVGSFPLNASGAVTAHTIAIDTAKGYAYCEGSALQPVRIISLANPEAPVFVNFFGPTDGQEIHDMFARNDTVFVAEGSHYAWSVWDCTNKANPALITWVTYPEAGFMHSVWVSEDRALLASTEETTGKTVKFWNISDLSNIQRRGEYIGASPSPHNVYLKGNFAFVAHYRAGITVVDISNPDSPVELTRYDTDPRSDDAWYLGCWSAYPYTRNGFVYASNMDSKLFVLRFGQNTPPAIDPFGPISVLEGTTSSFDFSVSDPDSDDAASWQVTGQPGWVSPGQTAGLATLTFTPGFYDSGSYSFQLIATDGFEADTEQVTVTVINTNGPPVLAPISPQTMRGGETLGVAFAASDPDVGPITFTASELKPHIALIDSGNGKGSLIFATGRFYIATDTVTVIASDGSLTDSTLAIITIQGQAKGDLNFDLILSAADVVQLVDCTFLGIGDCPPEVADGNCDGRLSGADIVTLLNAVFSQAPFPC